MRPDVTAQLSLFDADPEYLKPKYIVRHLGSRLTGLYSQHDVDAFRHADPEGWRYKFELVPDPVPQMAYAIEGRY